MNQVGLIVEEEPPRRLAGQWLDQLAERPQGKLLVCPTDQSVSFFSSELSKVFINPFSGTGRAKRRWEQVPKWPC